LVTEQYDAQRARWPRRGRHILAHFDEETIVVYQAYRPSIGRWAVDHGRLGGAEFSYGRMSWVKPNFLWMMYRSGWGTKVDQEVTLGLRVRRSFFEGLLEAAVESSYQADRHGDRAAWQAAVAGSDVRLQWDPDHGPHGAPTERRTIQLGLRGKILRAFGESELLDVIDLTEFMARQRAHLSAGRLDLLETPREGVYTPAHTSVSAKLALD
jgi:hypothetical protein